MKQLMQLLLSLPVADFCHFLRAKKELAGQPLIESILKQKAKAAGLSYAALTSVTDPLAPALKVFSERLNTAWQEKHPAVASDSKEVNENACMCEADRLALTSEWFQQYDKEHVPNITVLLREMNALIKAYTDCEDGYSANALTSLCAAITIYYETKKANYFYYFTPATTLPPLASLAVIKLYSALYQAPISNEINLLFRLDILCRKWLEKVEIYLEDYILTMVVAIEGELGLDGMLAMNPDYGRANAVSQHLLALRETIYDETKSTTERLTHFKQLFAAYHQHHRVLGNMALDTDNTLFKQNIQLLLSGNTLAQQSLFSLPLTYLPTWPAMQKTAIPQAKVTI